MGGGGGDLIKKQTNANQWSCIPQSGISASLFSMPNLVKPQDTLCVCNRKQTIMSDYISQTSTVSSCQSDISNQCRIRYLSQAMGGGGGGGCT